MRIQPPAICATALLALVASACGGGLKYKVDDSAMDQVPSGERQAVFAALNELEVAKGEARTAQSQLDALDRDRDIAKTEREQANLEVEKATAQMEAAIASRSENQAAQAKHNKDAADVGVKAAEQKLAWLEEKQEFLEAAKKAAEAHVGAAQAKVELEKARAQGWVNLNTGLIPGMAGLGVPVFDAQGRAVAALSVGTLADRLRPERLPGVVAILKAEAATLGAMLNPFDTALRHPSRSLSSMA